MFKQLKTKIMLLLVMILGGMNVNAQHSLTIDFESETMSYTDWTFNQILSKKTNSGVPAHGGSYFGTTNGSTGSVVTKEKIASPQSITFFISKQTTNNTASSWRVQVSTDGTTWTKVGDDQSASSGITKGEWTEVSRDLSSYSDVYVRIYYDGTSAVRCIDDVTLTYSTGGDASTCAAPTFSPAAGTYDEAQNVTISTTTDGATIYYTTDGTNPTTSSEVFTSAINVATTTTIKAIAVKENYSNSDVSTATYVIEASVSGYTVDFESNLDRYTDWEFTNAERDASSIEAHGGDYFATTGGKSTASFQTKESIAYPEIFTCYVSKTSTNTTASNWKVQVSEDGETWTDIVESSATDMTKGIWKSITANLSSYSNVYVRISYSGSTAVRAIDDISITMRDPSGKVTPNVVIDATALTNDLAGETNVSAGTATAAVMDGQNAVENVSVTWTSSDTGVATIDATTGAVTLIAAGTTTLTATFAGNDDYNEASGTYELTVIDSNAPGSENNPFTVAQAIAAVNNSTYNANQEYYISGIVSSFYEDGESILADNYHRYYISDDGTTSSQLLIFNGKGLNNVAFNDADDLLVGDVLTICGKLMVYNDNPEVAANNYIVSLERKEVKYYLAGSWGENDYGWGEGMEQLTKSGNTYTISKNLENGTLFKIVKVDETNGNATTWYGGPADGEWFGVSETVCEDLTLSSSGKNFKIEGTCDNAFTFTVDATDADNLKLTVTGWHQPEVKYYLAGNWTENWGDGKVELTENTDGTFSTSKLVGNGTRFKFVKTVDGAESWYGATRSGEDWGIHSEACTDIALGDASDAAAFQIQMAEDNELVFNLNADNMTFSVSGWPISLEGNMFVKVTSDADFTDGAYLIVNETAGVAFDGSLGTLDAADNVISVTIDDGKIVADATTKASLFTIVDGGKITSASGHYIGVSNYGNSLVQDNATYYNNSVTVTNGNADIAINAGGSNYVHLKYNKASDQNRFRYYKTGQQDIQLYKLVTLPAATATIAEACTDGTKYYGTYSNTSAFILPEGVTASEISVIDGELVVENYAAGATVPENTGVMISSETAGEKTFYLTTGGESVLGEGNMLRPTGAGVTADQMAAAEEVDCLYYRLTMHNGETIGFWWGAAEGAAFNVAANKAYLAVPAETGSKIQGFTFGNGGDATEIVLNALKGEQNGETYNLQGQKVGSEYKGIVIKNNKKYMVK